MNQALIWGITTYKALRVFTLKVYNLILTVLKTKSVGPWQERRFLFF